MKSWHELLMSTSDVRRVQFFVLAYSVWAFVDFDWPPTRHSDKWEMADRQMHSLLLFIRWEYFLHLMHSRYKDKHVLNHKLNSSITLILHPISKCTPLPSPKKSNPFMFVVQFHILNRSFYSNLILAEWHKPPSEYFHFFWQTPTSPLNKLHCFSLKLLQQDYRIKN